MRGRPALRATGHRTGRAKWTSFSLKVLWDILNRSFGRELDQYVFKRKIHIHVFQRSFLQVRDEKYCQTNPQTINLLEL